eukprot:IDg15335t1
MHLQAGGWSGPPPPRPSSAHDSSRAPAQHKAGVRQAGGRWYVAGHSLRSQDAHDASRAAAIARAAWRRGALLRGRGREGAMLALMEG